MAKRGRIAKHDHDVGIFDAVRCESTEHQYHGEYDHILHCIHVVPLHSLLSPAHANLDRRVVESKRGIKTDFVLQAKRMLATVDIKNFLYFDYYWLFFDLTPT